MDEPSILNPLRTGTTMALRQLHRSPKSLIAACLLVSLSFNGWTRGAADPDASDSPFTPQQQSHWAFQPIQRPEVPRISELSRALNEVDAFLLTRLQAAGLSYSPPADKRTLLRRAKFDLLGLPPTPDEFETFLADEAPGAYERLIDRLLASPHLGEAWGRDWLDLVRFAETSGYNADTPRPLAYKYRDYVIRALNDDRPYDRFLAEQLAGDELFPDDAEAIIAAGYNRLWPDESNATDILLARQDALNDLTANVGAAFLGLSIGCAQCHDHKFDPLLQADFYSLEAYFAGIVPEDHVPLGDGGQLAEYRNSLTTWRLDTARLCDEIHAIEQAARAKAGSVKRLKFPDVVLAAIDAAPESRTAYQRQLVFWSERQIIVDDKQLTAQMSDADRQRWSESCESLATRQADKPQPPHWLEAMTVAELPDDLPPTHLLAGGSYQQPLDEVQPAPPRVLAAANSTAQIQPPRPGTSGRRAALARWMTSPENPLVARVIVNRIWQGHFGRGLVENANDFGTQTPAPAQPELLDWLAGEFVRQGWSMKAIHRLIMTSNAYRQSAEADGAARTVAEQVDPNNSLFWHSPRHRLSAERIRDALLAASGELDQTMYGPGVRPELPPNYNKREKWDLSPSAADRNRRSVYIYAKRNLPFPMLQAFDLPDMHESCARRAHTTTPPQALALLNDERVLEASRHFAQWLIRDCGETDLNTVTRRAYEAAFGRQPTSDETAAAVEFMRAQRDLVASEEDSASGAGNASTAAVSDFCHALLNANEFLYVE